MLDEKRIKEAESNVRTYLLEGMLKKQTNQTAIEMYIENAELSLQTAQKILTLENVNYQPSLWIIVTSYYSMYYISNAILLKLGYKVGDKISHKITADAIIVLARNKLKASLLEEYESAKNDALELTSQRADELISSLDQEREKRSRFQYNMDNQAKRSKAITSIERAKEFVFEMKKLL